METSSDTNTPITLTITDTNVLDCYICYEPLSAPIYQCENGHSVCNPCSGKIDKSCPTCSMPISSIRNRALEIVLDSLKLKCQNSKYGCKKLPSYGAKRAHEKFCLYSPFYCLFSPCDYRGQFVQVRKHMIEHLPNVIPFTYGDTTSLVLKRDNQYFVLQESRKRDFFIVENVQEALGQGIIVSHFSYQEKGLEMYEFCYDLTVTNNGSSIKFESEMKSIQKRTDKLNPTDGFLLIPASAFSNSDGQVNLKLLIRRQCGRDVQKLKKSKVSPNK